MSCHFATHKLVSHSYILVRIKLDYYRQDWKVYFALGWAAAAERRLSAAGSAAAPAVSNTEPAPGWERHAASSHPASKQTE